MEAAESAELGSQVETAGGQRVVLVTGGGSGIGAAVTRLLTGAGDRVAICGRGHAALRAVAAQTGALDVPCDVADSGQVGRLVERVVGKFGRLDGLVLNAAVMEPGSVAELTEQAWSELVAVNLTGAFLVAKAALPHLIAARGAIVSVSSVAGLRASAGMAGYAATKAGLSMLTQSLAVDYAPDGLRANVVCPGWTVTEMADQEMHDFGAGHQLTAATAYQTVTALVPQRRPASAGEVASVIAWLLSDAASYVNGAVIPVDGGSAAVDAGTIAYDPRVSIKLDDPAS